MKNSILVFLCFIGLLSQSFAGNLSPDAKVSLITVGPGEELYSAFGHSAYWIFDPVNQIDRVYNYGTFDFDTPDFYSKFTKGKLNYMLSVSEMRYLLYGAEQERRPVVTQVLNLSPLQKENLFRFLETNYLPENRFYLYDFYYDNCSSRLRDALAKVCGDSLSFGPAGGDGKSFRQMIDPYLDKHSWADFGMDLGQGTPADKIATPLQQLFLPDYLKRSYDGAKLKKGSTAVPLVLETKNMLEFNDPAPSTFPTADVALWILFLLAAFLTYKSYKKGKISFTSDIILFIGFGLIGILIMFLWFGTDHKVTKDNWNLIWAMPIHILAALILLSKPVRYSANFYFLCYALGLIAFVLCWPVIPQEFNTANIPLILILALRAGYVFYKLRKENKTI